MRKHKGFTLVELVVVIMILGILAAVAAPKLLDTSSNAADNGIKQTLGIVRDAIERYAAEHGGTLPGDGLTDADFKADLKDYIRGPFPTCPVAGGTNTVLITPDNSGNPIAGHGSPWPDGSWHYCFDDGQFIVNSDEETNNDDDGSLTYDQL
jgi:prepilin-type N-terminal cleavage/methylation domain-containing protein